jgi:hypothetical protein
MRRLSRTRRPLATALLCGAGLALATTALGAPSGRAPGSAPTPFRRAGSTACRKASAHYAAAWTALRKLQANGSSAAARRHARRRLTRAYREVEKRCGAVFDVTAVNGTFDATVAAQDHADSCTTTKNAHWTASLGPGAEPIVFEVWSIDRHGRPSFAFDTEMPIREHGTGTATVTCSEPPPADNGTSTCTFNLSPSGVFGLQTDTAVRLNPQRLMWGFGFNSFSYANPQNGGACSYSGERPPFVEPSTDSPSLFVSPLNDGSNGLEPIGVTTVPVAEFAHSLSLQFSGSKSLSLDSTLDSTTLTASWQMTVSLRRRP